MRLFELFDKVADWKYTKKGQLTVAEFDTGNNTYEVDFDAYSEPVKVLFTLKGHNDSTGITDTGDQYIVFSTVLAVVQDYITTNNPDSFRFSAEEPSRIKLYDRIIKRLNRNGDWIVSHRYGNYVLDRK